MVTFDKIASHFFPSWNIQNEGHQNLKVPLWHQFDTEHFVTFPHLQADGKRNLEEQSWCTEFGKTLYFEHEIGFKRNNTYWKKTSKVFFTI